MEDRPMKLSRRQILSIVTSIAALSSASVGRAQTYPTRPVRLIVPFAPGGPADVLARLIGQKLSQRLGQQFYVENQPGAGGNLGMAAGARAAPDGYTLTVVGTSFVVNPSLYPKIPYDPLKDFAPVTLAAISPNVLVIHPSIPAKTVKELITFLKANPGKYSYAHAGNGTTPQLSGEMFRRSQGLDIVPVAFGGSAPAIQSVLGGHTPIGFTVLTPAVPQVKEGLLRALAVTTPKRSAALPDVPTLTEAGLSEQEADTILGVLAPAGTPEHIIALLYREIGSAMEQADASEKLAALGFDPVLSSPDDFAARIRIDIPKWAEVIRAARIRPD
jgi:tripartite-type tricarboxylate transporter receptor subunit TctC